MERFYSLLTEYGHLSVTHYWHLRILGSLLAVPLLGIVLLLVLEPRRKRNHLSGPGRPAPLP